MWSGAMNTIQLKKKLIDVSMLDTVIINLEEKNKKQIKGACKMQKNK